MHKLDKYKDFLEKGAAEGQDWSVYAKRPLGRYYTFKKAFELFEEIEGKYILELGTTRSFVHGGLEGCNSGDIIYWKPNNPETWDWGAGCFTRVAAECCSFEKLITVDVVSEHLKRCKVITQDFKDKIEYICSDSLYLLQNINNIQFVYLDTGDMTPIEVTANHQLKEAQIIVERKLIPIGGLVLIDDVKNTTPLKFGEKSLLGKAKYSLPFLLANGFELIMDEYQVLLRRVR